MNVKKLGKIYSEQWFKGKQAFGIVYAIIDLEAGLVIKVGRTETSLAQRRSQYKSHAKRLREQGQKSDDISKRINELYDRGGYSLIKKTLHWIPLEVLFRTGSKDENVEFDKKLLENSEQWWQNLIGTKDFGIDQVTGRHGPHSLSQPSPFTLEVNIPKIFINWRVLRKFLIQGMTLDRAKEFLSTSSVVAISRQDIIENIEYHWPFVADWVRSELSRRQFSRVQSETNVYRRRLYYEAQVYFMAPLIVKRIQSGLRTLQEVAESFRNSIYPQGLNLRRLQLLACYAFKVSSWNKVVAQCGQMPRYTDKLSIEEFRAAGGESFKTFMKHKIASLIVKGISIQKMIDNNLVTELTYSQIKTFIQEEWGSYDIAQRELCRPRLALAFQLYGRYEDFADKIANALPFIKYSVQDI